jgi:hypothetical protein
VRDQAESQDQSVNEQTWALLGVVIGAILGGVAPLLTTRMQRRASHEQWIRDHRREAHQAFTREWYLKYDKVWDAVFEYYGPHEIPEDYLIPLYRLTVDLKVFGSPESSKAGKDAYQALVDLSGAGRKTRKEQDALAESAMDTYIAQVRKDLGIR